MEADALKWALLVIGSVVIVGVAIHGIWVSRKNNEQKSKNVQAGKTKQQFQSAGQKVEAEFENESDDLDLAFDEQPFIVKKEPSVDELDFTVGNHASDDSVKTSSIAEGAEIAPEFDDLGLGAVRVVSSTEKPEAKNSSEMPAENQTQKSDLNQDTKVAKSDSKIYASVVTQPKPEYAAKYQSLAAETVAISQQEKVNSSKSHSSSKTAAVEYGVNANHNFATTGQYQAPEPPPFLLKDQPKEALVSNPLTADSPTMSETIKQGDLASPKPTEQTSNSTASSEKLSLGEQARNLVKRKKSESVKKRQEPKIAEDQMRIDFDDAPEPETAASPEQEITKEKPQTNQAPQQEVLVLNVKVAEGENIPGAALLPMLLTLGFKFGEQDIFHRHVNSNGKGPVLFSLANMFKPGNFDIDNLENFTTQGISLFMILPIEGEPHQVFNMMHNAARKIADEFSGQIYDGRRALLTKQSLQQYVEKIREFERRRMLNRQ